MQFSNLRPIILLIISIIIVRQNGIAQNIDSLLAIWNQPNTEDTVKLAAIHQLLSTKSYYLANQDSATILSVAHYNLAKQNRPNHLIDAIINRMNIAFVRGRFLEVINLADECLTIDSTFLTTSTKANALILKSKSLMKSGRNYESIKEYEKILKFSELSNDILVSINNGIGLGYFHLGQFYKATDAYQKNSEIIEKVKNPLCRKAEYNTYIGNVFSHTGNLAKALEFYKLALEFTKYCGDESMLIAPYGNIANTYKRYKEYEKAIEYYNLVLAISNKYNDKVKIFHAKTDIATIYLKQNLIQKAEELFSSIKGMIKDTEDKRIISFYYLNYGRLKLKRKQYEKAYNTCKKGYDISLKYNHTIRMKACSECLGEVSEQRKDYKTALSWFRKSEAFKDSLVNKQSLKRITQLEAELNYKDKENVYEKNILTLQLKSEQEQKNKILIISLLLASIPIILALLWIYRSEKKKANLLQQQKQLLEDNLKNKELIENQSKKLSAQEKLKSDFFTNIAHEFQTPLTIINGQSKNLLTNEALSQRGIQTISAISRNSSNLTNLTSQILEVAKSKEWKIGLQSNQFYLYELLNPIIEEYQLLAKEKKNQLKVNFNDTQDALMITDAYKLRIIILNLLSNAIKYSKYEGIIIVNLNRTDNNLLMEVKDNGTGIPEKEIPYIFDRFYQVSEVDNLKEQKGGFGIGLAICKEYTNLLNGKLTVKSILNKGSIFYLKIPFKINGKSTSNIEGVLSNKGLQNNVSPVSIPDEVYISDSLETILIVEDNRDFWLYLQNILFDHYNLVFKSNGIEAIKYLEDSTIPNLIITDIMMPYMDGITLIKSIKENFSFNFIPILVLTAKYDIGENINKLISNMDDYIIKPFDTTILLARIDYLLNLSENRFGTNHNFLIKQLHISEKDQVWLAKIENIVSSSISDFKSTPAKIAEKSGYSLVHLNRKLKSLIGLTLSKYILETRFRVALRLLEKKEILSVKAVSYAVGFKTIGYFSRNFKKRFGKYPSEYLIVTLIYIFLL